MPKANTVRSANMTEELITQMPNVLWTDGKPVAERPELLIGPEKWNVTKLDQKLLSVQPKFLHSTDWYVLRKWYRDALFIGQIKRHQDPFFEPSPRHATRCNLIDIDNRVQAVGYSFIMNDRGGATLTMGSEREEDVFDKYSGRMRAITRAIIRFIDVRNIAIANYRLPGWESALADAIKAREPVKTRKEWHPETKTLYTLRAASEGEIAEHGEQVLMEERLVDGKMVMIFGKSEPIPEVDDFDPYDGAEDV